MAMISRRTRLRAGGRGHRRPDGAPGARGEPA